jgi:predicted chitinase
MVNPNYTGMYLHQHGSTVSNGIFYWEENFNYSAYGQGWFEIRGVIK